MAADVASVGLQAGSRMVSVPQTSGLEILLVDAEEMDALVVRRQLPGTVVRWARTLEEGVTAARRGGYDAVLVDLVLPDAAPGTVVRSMAAAVAGTAPVIVITGVEDDALARQCVRGGAEDFIAKPEVLDGRLERRIAMALERTRLHRAAVTSEERIADWARAGAILWDWDLRTNRMQFASRWWELFAASEDADTPDAWFDLVHPDDQLRVCDAIVGVIDEGKPGAEVRHRMKTAATGYRWFSVRLAPCLGGAGRPVRVLGSHTDVTAECENPCGHCGADNPEAAMLCDACGEPLAPPTSPGATLPVDDVGRGWAGRTVAGRFVISRSIGAGGAGSVYLAHDRRTGAAVALKLLHPWLMESAEACERFLLEGRMQRELDHPNLVRVLDVGESRGVCFIATEFAPDGTLLDLLRARQRLSEARALGLLVPLVRGVEHAHRSGIVHRDIKPANIMLARKDGRLVARLTDFGVAKLLPRLSDTITGAVVGTLRYMAPEQFRDAKAADARSDVYSLAATLHQALSGCLPQGVQAIAASGVRVEVVAETDGIAPAIADVLRRALAEDPDDRPQTCAALADELESASRAGLHADETLDANVALPSPASDASA